MQLYLNNEDYFKPIILKFKTFIHNSNSKIAYNFCTCGGNGPLGEGEVTPRGKFFNIVIFRKNTSNYAKIND